MTEIATPYDWADDEELAGRCLIASDSAAVRRPSRFAVLKALVFRPFSSKDTDK